MSGDFRRMVVLDISKEHTLTVLQNTGTTCALKIIPMLTVIQKVIIFIRLHNITKNNSFFLSIKHTVIMTEHWSDNFLVSEDD